MRREAEQDKHVSKLRRHRSACRSRDSYDTVKTSSRLLIKSASGVLASLRGSTYRSVRLAFSLAAALLDSLSEQSAGGSSRSRVFFRFVSLSIYYWGGNDDEACR
jgi:hypothetical protein